MRKSWRKIEEELLSYYQGEKESLSSESFDFLERVGFVDNQEISDVGKTYLDSKYIFENDSYEEILKNQVLNLSEIRQLCQAFYGQNVEREKVEIFFRSKTEIQDTRRVGRILDILNQADIVSYSKKTGRVQFLETEEVEDENQKSYRIAKRTPYSNVKRLRKTIRSCEGDIIWVAKHFSKKGLEPLSEAVTGEGFERVRILTGPANVTPKMRSDFKRFKEEMSNRDIESELRVITDKEILGNLHDRWIMSDGLSWNIPPINSLYQNQEAEIHRTEEDIEFEDWWEDSKNIIEDWNNVQKVI